MSNEQLLLFRNGIQERLTRIRNEINIIFSRSTWEEQVIEEKQKINSTIKSIEKSIKNYNLEQIDDADVHEITSHFEQIFHELKHIEHNPFPHIKSISMLLTRISEILPKPIPRNTSRKVNPDFEKYADKIEEFERNCNQLNQIRENIKSLYTEIKNKDKEISNQAQEIQEKYNAICQDVENQDSLYTKIIKNDDRIFQIEKQATERLKTISQNSEEFEEKFRKNNEFLNELEQQKEKISNWEKEIENLLKKATNASLASSYEKTRKSYTIGIVVWHIIFFVCMIIMLLLSIFKYF